MAAKRTDGAFSEEEIAAMKDHAAEVKASRRRPSGKAGREEDTKAVLEKIGDMADADRVLAERIHEIVTSAAPELAPKLWYGMPAYARDGKVVCFFKGAAKFKSRYATFGFEEAARLDDGAMWPTSFAVTTLDADVESRIAALVKEAAG